MRQDTQQGNRRRRGGRRHRGPRSGSDSPSPRSSSSAKSSPKAPVKLSFFQRIIAFFTGKKPERPVPGNVYGKVLSDAPAGGGSRSGGSNGGAAAVAPAPARPKQVRKPELVEVTSPKLYVGNLSFDATESDLSELFSGVGQVQNSEVVSHRETQKSKGFAFVTMSSVDEAKRAVSELHDKEFMARRLVVSGAKTSDVR